jgi:2-oxoglutarate-Fe(II)-dependent oxygenase superfamily protein
VRQSLPALLCPWLACAAALTAIQRWYRMEIVVAADCIFYVRELLPQDLCQKIIEHYQQDPRRHPGHTVGSRGEKKSYDDVKVSTDLEIETGGVWSAVYAQLHEAVSRVVLSVAAQFPPLQVWPLQCTGYKIQHYRKDEGHFKWHFDALGPGAWDRQLAMVIYLNSVERGGETCFHRQQLRVKPVAGDAVFFPTFWTHMHCGEVATSGDKYVISSFVSFVIPAVDRRQA